MSTNSLYYIAYYTIIRNIQHVKSKVCDVLLINRIFEKFQRNKPDDLLRISFKSYFTYYTFERYGTCLLSKLSIPRLHDEDVSTIATHPTKSIKNNE